MENKAEHKSKNNVWVYIGDDGVCEIRLVGQIKYGTTAKGFSEFVNAKVSDSSVKDVIVDLRECDFIDSTNIATLAKIAALQQGKGAKKPTLVYCEDSKIADTIDDVYVKELYGVCVNKEMGGHNYEDVGSAETNQYELTKIMYEGHKLLASLSSANKERFESVVKYLGESVSIMERKTQRVQTITR
jgi:anti-anti-sigma regulatory factor